MQDSKMMRAGEESTTPPKPKKKKTAARAAPAPRIETEATFDDTMMQPRLSAKAPPPKGGLGSKKALKKKSAEDQESLEQPMQDSFGGSGAGSNEYRALRHKYLMLEEEHFSLGEQLNEAEAEVKTLEDEKHSLLDKLVVLEGLVDPAELRPKAAS